jgi:hypothetical protein
MTETKRRALPLIDILVFLAATALAVRNFMQHGTGDPLRLLLFTAIAIWCLVSLVKFTRQRG